MGTMATSGGCEGVGSEGCLQRQSGEGGVGEHGRETVPSTTASENAVIVGLFIIGKGSYFQKVLLVKKS